MKKMTTDDIRSTFLSFFRSKGHTVVPSDSLIPVGDPSLLFTGAGMNQFKEQFMGRHITYARATSSQKCLRTADLDNVGRTASHHSFFEMLGNFSFGDYFKKEAITWAWEFCTQVLSIDPARLWVSVYEQDSDAYGIWKDLVGIPEERIVRMGPKDNFWPANAPQDGPNGPCGPCSEIFFDYGKECGCGKAGCSPACDCRRFVEIWNLVFTQFERTDGGVLIDLPNRNIDTGMGLERIASVIQGVRTNFEIDIFQPLTAAIRALVPQERRALLDTDEARRKVYAIADHVRAAVFTIADGAAPSNEDRGYVVRKLVRRSVMNLHGLGVTGPALYRLVPAVAGVMGAAYPVLTQQRESIATVIKREEETALVNLDRERAEALYRKTIESAPAAVPVATLPVFAVFKLYDTYGVPLELAEEIARRSGNIGDAGSFRQQVEAYIEEQRESSRNASRIASAIFSDSFEQRVSALGLRTVFTGYTDTRTQATVRALFQDEERIERVRAPANVSVILDRTPFYGESGGQAGDTGSLNAPGLTAEVTDAKKCGEVILHACVLREGELSEGLSVHALIDEQRRRATARNHTATHLLQAALRAVLGDQVRQAGSVVDQARLRFDFLHHAKLSAEELSAVEDMVNGWIVADARVSVAEGLTPEEARARGALAFFGEKYGSIVRMVEIDGASRELCGGTHVARSADIMVVKIVSESAIASGVRRIEAVTGPAVMDWLREEVRRTAQETERLLAGLEQSGADTRTLRARVVKEQAAAERLIQGADAPAYETVTMWTRTLAPAAAALQREIADLIKTQDRQARDRTLAACRERLSEIIGRALRINGVAAIVERIDVDAQSLKDLVDLLKQRAGSCVVVLASGAGGKVALVTGVSDDLVKRGVDAAQLVRAAAGPLGGSGGGKAHLAQAGGKDAGRITEALDAGREAARAVLGKIA